jgi:hypothetical protein
LNKTSILVTLVLVFVLFSSSLSCSSASASAPESTIEKYISAINDNDLDKMLSCCVPEFLGEPGVDSEFVDSAFGTMLMSFIIQATTISNTEIATMNICDDVAEIYVEYDMQIVVPEGMDEMDTNQHFSGTALLERRGAEWLIAEWGIDSDVVNDADWVKLYPDLAIDEADISFSNNNPESGKTVVIIATVRNIGEANVKNAVIDFYDGPPRYDDLLGEVKLTVPAGGSAQAIVKWKATTGDHEIYVGISPYNAFTDSDYSNNGVFKSIYVTGPGVVADAGGPYVVLAGYPVVFNASGSTGPGGAPLQYRWDWDSNGSWDIGWLNTPIVSHEWHDRRNHSVTVEVSNGVLHSRDTTNVIVSTVAPTTGRIIYVDVDANSWGDGSSWDLAFNNIKKALNAAVLGDEIWVASGTYIPSTSYGGVGDRFKTFKLKEGVAIYGGFSGIETDRDARDWEQYITILSGDIGIPGHNSDNCYHVVTGANYARLDGFTITHGNGAEGMGNHAGGTGMYNEDVSPVVANCIFRDNTAGDIGSGGGMYNAWGSSPTILDTSFINNYGGGSGGGIGNNIGSSPLIENCLFAGNTAIIRGGAISNNQGSSPKLVNCTVVDNSAFRGGGMDNNYQSDPTISDCTFQGNYADLGPQIYHDGDTLTIEHSEIEGGLSGIEGPGTVIHDGGL